MNRGRVIAKIASPIYTDVAVARSRIVPWRCCCWRRRCGALPARSQPVGGAERVAANLDTRDVRCVERPEGCVWCEGRGPACRWSIRTPSGVAVRPKDPGQLRRFLSRAWRPSAPCPWRTVPSCLLPSEHEFRRELFRRDTADRPEAVVQGRVTDEAGHRVEGAKISVWFQGTPIAEEISARTAAFTCGCAPGP
jgi:hypothetical protein